MHFGAYAGLAMLLCTLFWARAWKTSRILLLVVPLLLAYGAVDEVLQSFVGRTADVWDWVADTGGRILGGVVLNLGDHAHLANLAVHPDGAGQGIGQNLTQIAFDAAIAEGFDHIHLATHKDMTATQAFYLHRGWVETGREGTKVYMSFDLRKRKPLS